MLSAVSIFISRGKRKKEVVLIREREIELKLRKATADRGGLCLKFAPTNWAGAPDRLVILSEGRMGFVEVKAPGQRARPLQVARHRRLAELGCYVAVLDDPQKVDAVLDEIERHTAATPQAAEAHSSPSCNPKAAEGYEHENTVNGAAEGYEHENTVNGAAEGYEQQNTVKGATEEHVHQNTVNGAVEDYAHQNMAEKGSDKHAGSG